MVVADQPRERGEAVEQRPQGRELPLQIDVPRPVRLPDDVDRSVAGGLEGDVRSLGRNGVARVEASHAASEQVPRERASRSQAAESLAYSRDVRSGYHATSVSLLRQW